MKTHFLSLILFAMILASSCSQEEIVQQQTVSLSDCKFVASFEQNESRTYLEDGKYLRWTANDELSIFMGKTLNRQFRFTGETGDNSGGFEEASSPGFVTGNDLDNPCHYAIYPYAKGTKITETGVLTVNLPSEQTYEENSFGCGANTMVAVTSSLSDMELSFKNACGYLKFKLYGDDVTVKSVTLQSNGEEKLSGSATLIAANDKNPSITMSSTASDMITLDCGTGVKIGSTSETATEFWFVVPPTTFESGFTVTIKDVNDNEFTKSTSKKISIERNIIKPISAFEVEIVEKIPSNQIWYTSTYGKISPDSDAFGVAITSNVYQDGEGIITFDGDVRKIGDDAFIAQDRLASITLPNSVKSIGREAFASCTSLTSIIMSKNITTIEREAFEECSSLTSISIPNGVTQIEFETFRDCSSLTSVTIPNSVISVGGSSFYNCTSLTSVNIPNSVTSIYGTTFHGCASLKSIVVEQGNPIYDSRENCNAIIETETNKLISGCNNTSIPSSVTSISQQAFSGRTSLTSILVPNSVTSIEFLAFADCTSLASITIGSGVTDIATKAFLGCTSLSTVDITATIPPQIYNETFTNCSSNLKIYVPAESINAYKAADYWKDLNIMSEIVAVDLGLSVKWANCNIGANNPHEYGDYFAWGETAPKSSYDYSNMLILDKIQEGLKSTGVVDSNGNLTAAYDAATVNWGGNWRMPTRAEIEEILNNCTWTWTTQNDTKGYLVCSKTNGNSIFLPAAGFRQDTSLGGSNEGASYWSSTYDWDIFAFNLQFNNNGIDTPYKGCNSSFDCSMGFLVRPVTE